MSNPEPSIDVDATYGAAPPPPPPDQNQNTSSEQPSDAEPRPPPLTRASTASVDKCWICLSTRDEDDPQNPPVWRHPCKCSLSAHESCLLDWVADQENPKNRRSQGGSDQILCPQCKSEIMISRPTNVVVTAVRKIDRAYGRLVLPGLAGGLFGMIFTGFWAYGRTAVFVVFGPDDYHRLLEYAHENSGYDAMHAVIPFSLIFSRTRYSDFVTPLGTMFLLWTQLQDGQSLEIDWTVWPPLPSTVFACLPVARQFYNWGYEKMFGDLNKKWIAAVQPNREEGYEGQDQNIADILNEQEQQLADEEGAGGVVLELELNLGGGNNNVDDEVVVNGGNGGEDGEAFNGGGGGGDGEGDEDGAQGGPNQPGQRVHQLLGDNELMDDTSSIGQLVIGALALPAVSAVSGHLLKLALPASLTSPVTNFGVANGRPGLLASQWGRAVVGGCLFVALKDALVLYCRWRLAAAHQMRRIMDFDKETKEYKL